MTDMTDRLRAARDASPGVLRPAFDHALALAAEHAMTATSGCICGWGSLGKSFVGHVAGVTEAAVREQVAADIEAKKASIESAQSAELAAVGWMLVGFTHAARIARGGAS